MLSAAQVSKNYQECYRLTGHLLKQKFNQRGFEADPDHPEFVELCQSVVGHESVVLLLQSEPFAASLYRPALEIAIDEVKRLLFPDIRKKRFVSIDALETEFLSSGEASYSPEAERYIEAESAPGGNSEQALALLKQHIAPDLFEYLHGALLERFPGGLENIGLLLRSPRHNASPLPFQEIETKLRLLRRVYPGGEVQFTARLNGLDNLGDAAVAHAYLNVYIGLERSFPANFLQRDGERRAALLVRFLIEQILNARPDAILEQKDETFFIRHKLQNVYRFFNYSANRALGNAYPDLIHPWQQSRSASQYWEKPAHRVKAIRWLVEQRLGIRPEHLYQCPVSKEDFIRHGLSYMFNRYYNSVSKALAEAYPQLQPWELGKVPFEFWNEETTARAIRWAVAKKGWAVEELPAKVRSKEFNRKVFSEFGLATVFEKKLSRNIYRAVSAAWPGRFAPWELGKVPSEYWESRENVYSASKWIAEREGIRESEIVQAIRGKRLSLGVFKKYSIGAALARLCKGRLDAIFAPLFWREQRQFLQEHKLLRKAKALKNSQRKSSLLDFFLYGLFWQEVQKSSLETMRRYERIAHRIQRRSFLYSE
ncbi:MAG: hypothetical protein HUU32_02440 [Calditrichaceae bacterium]|nr:hypothetical protein [Calditrichia bacterium]NUQ40236.1 hypothetical protein [Calditrichaceae bacterium]